MGEVVIENLTQSKKVYIAHCEINYYFLICLGISNDSFQKRIHF